MKQSTNLQRLPEGLPVPVDDGASDHLPGRALPPLPLTATNGQSVALATLPGRTVVFAYPMTGRPDRDIPAGWDEIPGARGCTPQACAFRDLHQELRDLGARVFGLSTQDPAYQREAVERLHLPYPLLSDADLTFTHALALPTFMVEGMTLLKRLTMVIDDGRITHVFYPIFPPNENAANVAAWLREH